MKDLKHITPGMWVMTQFPAPWAHLQQCAWRGRVFCTSTLDVEEPQTQWQHPDWGAGVTGDSHYNPDTQPTLYVQAEAVTQFTGTK